MCVQDTFNGEENTDNKCIWRLLGNCEFAVLSVSLDLYFSTHLVVFERLQDWIALNQVKIMKCEGLI